MAKLRDPKTGRYMSPLQQMAYENRLAAAQLGQTADEQQVTAIEHEVRNDTESVQQYCNQMVELIRANQNDPVQLRLAIPIIRDIAAIAVREDVSLTKGERKRIAEIAERLVQSVGRKAGLLTRVGSKMKKVLRAGGERVKTGATGLLEAAQGTDINNRSFLAWSALKLLNRKKKEEAPVDHESERALLNARADTYAMAQERNAAALAQDDAAPAFSDESPRRKRKVFDEEEVVASPKRGRTSGSDMNAGTLEAIYTQLQAMYGLMLKNHSRNIHEDEEAERAANNVRSGLVQRVGRASSAAIKKNDSSLFGLLGGAFGKITDVLSGFALKIGELAPALLTLAPALGKIAGIGAAGYVAYDGFKTAYEAYTKGPDNTTTFLGGMEKWLSKRGLNPFENVAGWFNPSADDVEREMRMGRPPQSERPITPQAPQLAPDLPLPARAMGEFTPLRAPMQSAAPDAGQSKKPVPSAKSSSSPQRSSSNERYNYNTYKEAIGKRESGGKYDAVNQFGYLGKYQMGLMALEDSGLVKTGTSKKGQSRKTVMDESNWTIVGGAKAFLKSPQLQERVMREYTERNLRTLQQLRLVTSTTSPERVAGLLAASHLIGPGGVKKHGLDGQDGNGTKASEYFQLASTAEVRQASPSAARSAATIADSGNRASGNVTVVAPTNVVAGGGSGRVPTASSPVIHVPVQAENPDATLRSLRSVNGI